jgi:hypothetical protein
MHEVIVTLYMLMCYVSVKHVMSIYRTSITTFVNIDNPNVLYSIGAELVVITSRDQLVMLSLDK